MNLVPIGEICALRNGRAFKPTEWSTSGTPIIRIQNLTDENKPFNYCKFEVDRKFHVNKGDLLFSWSGTPGTSFGAFFWRRERGYLNQHIFRIDPYHPKELYLEYFRLVLNSKLEEIIRQAHGGVGLQHITKEKLNKVKVYLPEYNDQKRIAHLLGKAEGLISRRKHHLQQLDDLLKSVFLEMFGDPVRNEKGWDTSELEKLCEEVIDCPHSTPVYSDEKTDCYCVRSGDIVDGYLDLSKTLHVGREIYEERIKRYTPQIDDIVYSREGGRLGNAARILGGESICLGQRIMLFKAGGKNSPDFLWALLESRSFKAKLQGLVGGGAAPRVNIKDLKKITIIKPPNDTQTQFSRVAKRIDQIKSRYQQSLADLENLYGALSQKAFKGKLDLSRVVLPDEPVSEAHRIDEAQPSYFDVGSLETQLSTLDTPAMSLKQPRQELLRRWFQEWFDEADTGGELRQDEFWNKVRVMATDHSGENDESSVLTCKDYDLFKQWIFDAISEGKVEQTLNQIEVDGKPEFGNQVILKKAG